MIIKEANFTLANEVAHSFRVGAPDITNRSIRFLAFDFDVIEIGSENYEYYESAILVFEGVVSSTRNVKTFTHEKQVEGQITYEIVDGPFDPVSGEQEVFHFEFQVYANSARAWVDWNIVAVSMRIEEIDKKALTDFAQKRGVKLDIAEAALEGTERHAIRVLLADISLVADYRLILPLYCTELIKVAKQKNRLLEIADLLIQRPNHALLKLADELSAYHTPGCASLICNIIASGYDASDAMIRAIYSGADGLAGALQDPSEPVRVHAAKKLEVENNIAGLNLCLQNDSASVREIAGWYVGLKKVSEAANALVKQLSNERFTPVGTHAEIEALRSAIWALGVLRIDSTRSCLEL